MKRARMECEILVVGGGVAGVGAAVAAARESADTILVEKRSFPGGAAIAGLHRFICGLYANGKAAPADTDTLNDGIPRELCRRLKKLAPHGGVQRMGMVYVFPFATADLAGVLQSLTVEEKRLHVMLGMEAVSVDMESDRERKGQGGRISSVTVRSVEEECTIVPRVVIDGSGDACIARMSGASSVMPEPHLRQLAGFSLRVKGLKEVDDLLGVKIPYVLAQSVAENSIPFHLKFTTFTPGDAPDEGTIKLGIPPAEDGRERNERAREDALLVHRLLAHRLPAFEDSSIIEMSAEVVDREGPLLCGEYTLTADDVVGARKFSDGIVKNAWPMEVWDRKKGPRYRYLEPGEYYEIPMRCLKSPEVVNCYWAGRCISVTREALGSTRVMGPCLALGEQAGRAAARDQSGGHGARLDSH